MGIYPANCFPGQASFRYERKNLGMIRDWNSGKAAEERLLSIRQAPEGQFPEHERMQQDCIVIQKLPEGADGRDAGQILPPHRGVDDDSRHGLTSTPGSFLERHLPEQRLEPSARLDSQESLKAHLDDRGLRLGASLAHRLLQEIGIQIESRSHAYDYASFICTFIPGNLSASRSAGQ